MEANGMALMSYPAIYEHRCGKCGAMKRFSGERYPMIKYEYEKGDGER